MSEAETEAKSGTEVKHFQAEVEQLLNLMINSLYGNKEIFLRELVSNASDAIDKLKFEALAKPELFEEDADLKIWVDFDKEAKTVTIRDNGIGMSRDEIERYLGTIANSGTKKYIESLSGDRAKDSKLIGQFGVGFYSAFIVADKVTVSSRRAGLAAEDGVRWSSAGKGEYEIQPVRKSDRGTEIVLHLKPEEEEFLNSWQLRHVITKYSDHLSVPIIMKKEPEPKTPEEAEKDKDVIDVPEDEVINKATALWTRPKQDVKQEEYDEFYKHIAHDFEGPLAYSHNKVEGKLEYTSLLFVPKRAPFDLWQQSKPKGLKLYVQRVFIMDDAEQFLPNYLRFVRGVIDSNDLPLNVSREILQSNKTVDTIRGAIVKRILSMLEGMAKNSPDNYKTFWKEFGQVIKEGPAEDFGNKERIAKLLRFSSTHDAKEEQEISLEDYVSRMQEGQDKIYYIAAETFNAAKNSPHLEIFRKKGIEVLLLNDRVDEWLMAHMTEFDGKKLQSVAKGGLDLGEDTEEEKQQQEELSKNFEDVVEKVKKSLGERVKDVKISNRLTSSPACIVSDENDMTPQMERIMRAAGQNVPTVKPILELNPEHMLVLKLKDEAEGSRFDDISSILLDQAILSEGGQLEDPASFVARFNALLLDVAN